MADAGTILSSVAQLVHMTDDNFESLDDMWHFQGERDVSFDRLVVVCLYLLFHLDFSTDCVAVSLLRASPGASAVVYA